MRMMRHEARTCTIQALTGLTEDRIRKLYRAYLANLPATVKVQRHRGQSPQQAGIFLQTAAFNFEASTLASMFCIAGLLCIENEYCAVPSPTASMTLEQAENVCQVFESYTVLRPPPRLSFEYAWFLLQALLSRKHLRLARCPHCGRIYVEDAA